ncbi:trypsin-like serine protease [Baaleninema sp.]|uniref:trypsin-like serine protease n=1 Tax=Baaleninema sp. TaxID=3101197 RepID=UPI003D05843C
MTARRPRIAVPTSNADDASYVVEPGNGYDGVVEIADTEGGTFTGTLLTTGRHILTAAHGFNTEEGAANLDPDAGNYRVAFDLPDGRVSIDVSRIFVHPEWTADLASNNDIAIVELAETAPNDADRYEIYTGSDEISQVGVKVGYGGKGTGTEGQLSLNPDVDSEDIGEDSGVKRLGQNRYDAFADLLNSVLGTPFETEILSETQLAYDFDDGTAARDFFGTYFNIADTGLGAEEVNSTQGDSGGPTFIEEKIAGITSYGYSPIDSNEEGELLFAGLTGDANTDVSFISGEVLEIDTVGEIARAFVQATNSSFGEFSSDTRVSAYADYIAQTLAEAQSGDDSILGTTRDDTLNGNAGNDSIEGLEGDDILAGGQGDDVVSGDDGLDTLYGNLGNDEISGGEENDLVFGNEGNDSISGDAGDDELFGGEDADSIFGGEGADSIFGGLGEDVLDGGEDNDLVVGLDGDDEITLADGDDMGFGGQGNDEISGDAGDDEIFGGQGDDSLFGGDGNDTLTGELGQDVLTGGEGEDVFVLSLDGAVTDVSQADIVEDFSFEDDRIGLTDGLENTDVVLENATVGDRSGVVVKVIATDAILGFVADIDTVPFVTVEG